MKKRLILISVFSFFCFLSPLHAQDNPLQQEERVWAYFWAGMSFFEKEDHAQAIVLFEKALKVNADFYDSHYFLAQSYKKLNRLEESLSELKLARELMVSQKITPLVVVQDLDLLQEIKDVETSIKEKNKPVSPKLTTPPELPEKTFQVKTALVSFLEDGTVKIFLGEKDGMSASQKVFLSKAGKKQARLSLSRVAQFFSIAKLEEQYEEKVASPGRQETFEILIAAP